jgi:hypothetical protein
MHNRSAEEAYEVQQQHYSYYRQANYDVDFFLEKFFDEKF